MDSLQSFRTSFCCISIGNFEISDKQPIAFVSIPPCESDTLCCLLPRKEQEK